MATMLGSNGDAQISAPAQTPPGPTLAESLTSVSNRDASAYMSVRLLIFVALVVLVAVVEPDSFAGPNLKTQKTEHAQVNSWITAKMEARHIRYSLIDCLPPVVSGGENLESDLLILAGGVVVGEGKEGSEDTALKRLGISLEDHLICLRLGRECHADVDAGRMGGTEREER